MSNNEANLPSPTSSRTTSGDGVESEEKSRSSRRKYAFYHLYRYADPFDIIAMVVGTLLALGRGAALPAALLYYAKILNAMITYSPCWDHLRAQLATMTIPNSTSPNNLNDKSADIFQRYLSLQSDSPLFEEVGPYCRNYAWIGLGIFIAGCLHYTLWTIAGQRQLQRIRTRLFRAMLNKDAGWFDAHRSGALNTLLFEQVRKMEDGMGANVSLTAAWIGTAVSGFLVAFVTDWLVSIVIFSLVPLMVVVSSVMIKLVRTYSAKQLLAYSRAGSIANEVISNVRTVQAFNKQEYEVKRYADDLGESMRMGTIKTVSAGVAQGLGFLILNSICGLAFWWGNNPHVAQAGGNIMQIILCTMIATTALANASPNFEAIASAVGAADEVFSIIDEASRIDNFSEEGWKLENITGNISFENVAFTYPSRPDRPIFKSLSLEIESGQTVALVGPSGCGKSTAAQMLLRFYETISGKVSIDGVDIRELNVRWLRQHIGFVCQEPVLFNTTIKENVRLGALDRGEVPDEDIVTACKLANAHNFIAALPDGYDTMVGEGGAQLSGGQKQRIAIARALISNPRILVLDEATSALDTNNEKVVQEALDNARVGRTTLVIAHRLSTIRNADKIAVIDGGVVAELGDHATLMNKGGLYYRLVRTQEVEAEKKAKKCDKIENGFVESNLKIASLDETKEDTLERQISPILIPNNGHSKSIHEAENGRHYEVVIEKKKPGRFELMNTMVLKWGRPELIYTVACCLLAMLEGGLSPAFAIVTSEFAGSFCPFGTEDKFTMLIGVIVGLGAFHACVKSLQHWLFSVIGERLTKRVRCLLLGKILRMDSSWLDRQENQPSILTTILATDCIDIQGISGIRISLILSTSGTLAIAVVYSLVLDYRVALAMLGIMPLIIIAMIVFTRVVMQGSRVDEGVFKGTAIIAMDALSNMRTIMSLGAEPFFLERFTRQNFSIEKSAIKTGILAAPLITFPIASVLWSGAITFSLGSWLLERKRTTFLNVIRIYTLITFCGMAIGQQSPAVPDQRKARKSAKKLLDIISYETQIDREDPKTGESLGEKELEQNEELLRAPCIGKIEFKNVAFNYPNRPAIPVLKNVSFTVEPGQQVALCGTSGGGKSTIMQLVLRLYDPTGGEILVDGVDIRRLNVRLHRSNIGLVSQEPVLFALTVSENVAYGSRMPNEKPTKEQIDKACEQADVHSFVQKLREGFNTFVGERGAQLSGGQKQRIAIARALVRNPPILLLDEATSALDSESERAVQESLDLAAHGRTSLTIAHRLSTIQNAEKVLVLDGGIVAEQGTHAELMAKRGIYYNLQFVPKSNSSSKKSK